MESKDQRILDALREIDVARDAYFKAVQEAGYSPWHDEDARMAACWIEDQKNDDPDPITLSTDETLLAILRSGHRPNYGGGSEQYLYDAFSDEVNDAVAALGLFKEEQ